MFANMTTDSANLDLDDCPRRVVQVIYPGVTLLDVTGPAQVFGSAGNVTRQGDFRSGPERYDITVASLMGGPVPTDTGVALDTVPIDKIAPEGVDTFLVAGGMGVFDAQECQPLVDWVRESAPQARRFGSTCVGAFLLSRTGLNAGQRVTTHWRWAAKLQSEYPGITVEPEQLFFEGNPAWSSAGITSGVDMSLAMVQADFGHRLSIELAKAILVYYRRPGNQSQYSNRLRAQMADEAGRFEGLHEWMADNLDGDLSTAVLADKQAMSERNFARVYKDVTGFTPAKAVEQMRVDEAKKLLTREGKSAAAVARAVGFGNETTMRRAFLRVIDMTPSEFQSRYLDRAIAAE